MDDVTVLVFGPLRERVGAAEVHVAGATVQEVWDELVRRHPAAAVDAGSVRAARNIGYCEWNTAVRGGDTIAFIPPVAGGSGDASVLVVVTAPHRDAAFPACQEALELIKTTVPVWKREHRPDGARWVDG